MPVRAVSNALFYTNSAARCREWIAKLIGDVPLVETPGNLVAGIVPHAGWTYSGAVAARVWKNLLASPDASTVIIFGAVHYPGVTGNTVYPEGHWETPLGSLEVDAALARQLLDNLAPLLEASAAAHEGEHSIEVQLPFVRALRPDARILPIAVPPTEDATQLGRRIGELTRGNPVVAAGSTDLTHYGDRFLFTPGGYGAAAHEWMRQNDDRMIDLMLDLKADEVVEEASTHQNACGSGAVAATLAFAAARGAEKGILLEHTTSHEVQPEGEFEMAVGYAGVVF